MLHNRFGRRRLFAGGAGMLALAAGAARAQEVATVTVDHHDFAPRELMVKAGTKVVWTNRDSEPHNVVSAAEPRLFRSRLMDTGDDFEFTFATPGRYSYYCALHPQMQGTILVE
jgi:plastocyanin